VIPSRLDETGRKHLLTAKSDVAALWETASGKGVHSQEVRGKGAGINHFDSPVPSGGLHHAAAFEPVSACHGASSVPRAVEDRTSDGFVPFSGVQASPVRPVCGSLTEQPASYCPPYVAAPLVPVFGLVR
jgi:hypothetical protein